MRWRWPRRRVGVPRSWGWPGVGGEVAAELAGRLGELARLDADVVGEVGGEVVDGVPGTEDVAVPEEPLQALQLLGDVGGRLGCGAQALGHSWVSTVMRIVRWNQSSRCSACGLR